MNTTLDYNASATPTPATLSDLLAKHGVLAQPSRDAVPITGVSFDSRSVEPGDLFVCKGRAFCPAYLSAALDAGAVCYLCDTSLSSELENSSELEKIAGHVPRLVTSNIRAAMAYVSAEIYRHPDDHLTVVGITGTKGKTTATYMLRAILDKAAPCSRVAYIGSIETFDGVEQHVSHNTTPESPALWRHLAHARDARLPYAVLEISSQALKYDRTLGITFDIAIFLNIETDHISAVEHADFNDYLSSKLRIFDHCGTAVVNLGSAHLADIMNAAQRAGRVITFSAAGPEPVDGIVPDVWAYDVTASTERLTFLAHTPKGEHRIQVGMGGDFNIENALAALAAAELCGASFEEIECGLANTAVPGRMEIIESDDKRITAVVDYAHNELSFTRLFQFLKKQFPECLRVGVFGTPGDKAQERRKQLPCVAAKYCDHIVFTEDDPGHERVEDICAELARHVAGDTSHEIIPDRTAAIQRAISWIDTHAHDDQRAVLAVLGKGHEATQHRGSEFVVIPPDREVVRCAFAARQAGRATL